MYLYEWVLSATSRKMDIRGQLAEVNFSSNTLDAKGKLTLNNRLTSK